MATTTNPYQIEIAGVLYKSVASAYKILRPEFSLSTFRRKVRNGVSDINELTKKHKDFVIQGFHYSNTKTAYEDLEPPISLSLFRSRIANGVSDEKLMEPARQNNAKDLTYFGKRYDTIKSAYDDLKPDISLNTFYWRVKQGYTDERLMMSNDEHLEKYVFTIGNKRFKTIRQAYEALKPNVTLAKFYKCVRKGMSEKEIMGL